MYRLNVYSQAHAGLSHTGPSFIGPADTGPLHTGPAHIGPLHTGPAQTGPARDSISCGFGWASRTPIDLLPRKKQCGGEKRKDLYFRHTGKNGVEFTPRMKYVGLSFL